MMALGRPAVNPRSTPTAASAAPPAPEAGLALTELTLRIRHDGCIAAVLPEGARLAQLSGDAAGGVFVLHVAREAERDAALAAIEARTQRRASLLARAATSIVFRVQGSLACPLARRLAQDAVVLWPVLYSPQAETHRVLCASGQSARRLVQELAAVATVEVLSSANAPIDALDLSLPIGGVAGALTRRQLDALELAITNGYYDVPRDVDTQTLAKTFGVGRSTYEEHLRKAERVVLMQFGSLLTAHARLAEGATKGRGRPPRL